MDSLGIAWADAKSCTPRLCNSASAHGLWPSRKEKSLSFSDMSRMSSIRAENCFEIEKVCLSRLLLAINVLGLSKACYREGKKPLSSFFLIRDTSQESHRLTEILDSLFSTAPGEGRQKRDKRGKMIIVASLIEPHFCKLWKRKVSQ